jgi:hypothetical protein
LSNNSQILGFLDVLSKKRDELRIASQGKASDKERPILIFMTTSDTQLSNDIVVGATSRGVRIFQMKATVLLGDPQSDLYVGFGRPIPLNYQSEAVYINKIIGGLRPPVRFPLVIPDDIDDADDDDDE